MAFCFVTLIVEYGIKADKQGLLYCQALPLKSEDIMKNCKEYEVRIIYRDYGDNGKELTCDYSKIPDDAWRMIFDNLIQKLMWRRE